MKFKARIDTRPEDAMLPDTDSESSQTIKERLGSPAFRERSGLSVIASDANFLRMHKENNPHYTGEIPDPVYAEGLWVHMHEEYQAKNPPNPFELLVEKERLSLSPPKEERPLSPKEEKYIVAIIAQAANFKGIGLTDFL